MMDSLRRASFQVVTVITTTGFQTIDSYAHLAPSTLFIFIFLMFIDSEAGSTAGGMKIYRTMVAAHGLRWALREIYGSKRRVFTRKINRFGKRVVCTDDEVREASTFLIIYIATFAIGSFLFTLTGASVQNAIFDFASCLGNVGVSIGFLGPSSDPVTLCVASLGMFLGRLEIIPVFLGIYWLATKPRRKAAHER